MESSASSDFPTWLKILAIVFIVMRIFFKITDKDQYGTND